MKSDIRIDINWEVKTELIKQSQIKKYSHTILKLKDFSKSSSLCLSAPVAYRRKV